MRVDLNSCLSYPVAINIFMKTVFNQKIVNLDRVLEIDRLLAMRPTISALIAANSEYIRPTKYSSSITFDSTPGIADYAKTIHTNLDKLPNKDLLSELITNDSLGTYLLFEESSEIAEGLWTFTLLYEKNGNTEQSTVNHKFNFLYEWFDRQNIFEKYTGANFFVNWKGTQTIVHKDWDSDDAEPWHALHINFSDHKHLFLLDSTTGEKTYCTGCCNYFDSRNWHGTDPAVRSCFSLRVIGKFTPEFIEKIKSQSNL
jgi:hypothetical protein